MLKDLFLKALLLLWVGVLAFGCGRSPDLMSNGLPNVVVPSSAEPMNVESTAFEPNSMIPSKYTCDGNDVSPPLRWSDVPPETESLVLIVDDPDAPNGTFVHWVAYNIPPDVTELSEGVSDGDSLPVGGSQGKNNFRKVGYGGPCPPQGTHRYVFKLYALDTTLDLPAGASKADVTKAMDGHVLGFGELIGLYARR